MEFADKRYTTGYDFEYGKPVCSAAKVPSLFNLCVNKLRKMGLNISKMNSEALRLFLSPKIPDIVIDDIYYRSIKFSRTKKKIKYIEEVQIGDKVHLKGRIMTIKEELITSDCNILIRGVWNVDTIVETISRKVSRSKYKLRCQILFYDEEWETYEECARSKDLVYLPGFGKIICGNCLDNPKSKELLFGSEP